MKMNKNYVWRMLLACGIGLAAMQSNCPVAAGGSKANDCATFGIVPGVPAEKNGTAPDNPDRFPDAPATPEVPAGNIERREASLPERPVGNAFRYGLPGQKANGEFYDADSVAVARIPLPLKRFLCSPGLKGATVALSVKEVCTGKTVYAYGPDLAVTPASVMKTVTTAAALEILGGDYTFPTVLEYSGRLENGVLHGNLYVRGSGDPTLGSAYAGDTVPFFADVLLGAVRAAGIREIRGAVVADEGCFDLEGVSWKWVNEDLGSYYGAGSYGINVFDNTYRLYLRTGAAGSRPVVGKTVPPVDLDFRNHLICSSAAAPEYYISGNPFSRERTLYGTVPAGNDTYTIQGDIPDPALFLATYLTGRLQQQQVSVAGEPTCRRLLEERGAWTDEEKTPLFTHVSPPLRRIVRIVNEHSQNLYADILAKTLGTGYTPMKPGRWTSFRRGTARIVRHWERHGLDTSLLWMYDGSGLAVTDKLTAGFLTDLLVYMRTRSRVGTDFYVSLPVVGKEGTVKNFLKGTGLEGKARLKSGSMSRIKSYAGYVHSGGKEYAVALVVNNYPAEAAEIRKEMEELLLALF